MRRLIAYASRLPGRLLRHGAIVAALGFCMVCAVFGDDIVVTEQTFSCLLDWPKVRGTYLRNDDPQRLQEAIRIFRDQVPDTEYPVGTIFQVIPFEAMVKHEHGTIPKTHDWEFFTLDATAAGTKILDRGENVLEIFDMDAAAAGAPMGDHPRGVTCLSCHQGGAKYDMICEKGHGCAPIPLNDAQLAKLQQSDPRCAKK